MHDDDENLFAPFRGRARLKNMPVKQLLSPLKSIEKEKRQLGAMTMRFLADFHIATLELPMTNNIEIALPNAR
jgi:hypothetical protein